MKSILIASVLGIALLSPRVDAQSTEQVLGAIAGGALGSTVGDGDGRKAATVLGAIIGYRNGERILNGESTGESHPRYYRDDYVDYNGLTRNEYRVFNYCKSQVPPKYKNNSGAVRSWVNGCVARIEQMQQDIEAQAYQEALNGSSYK